MKHRTAFFIALLLVQATVDAWADDPLRPYSGGAVTANDFKMTPPPLADRPTHNGVPLTAFIYTNLGFSSPVPECTGAAGNISCTVSKVTVTASVDTSKSWITEPTNDEVLKHEQGHLDEAELAARNAQAEINKRLKDGTLKGNGATADEAKKDLAKKVSGIVQRHLNDVEDPDHDGRKNYDEDTAHGRNKDAQAQARKRLDQALNSPGTDADKKKSTEALSRTSKSIHFDAIGARLTIDSDYIVGTVGGPGYVQDPLEAVLGAEVIVPAFRLLGQTVSGAFFFGAEGVAPLLRIVGDAGAGDELFSAEIGYLLYDPELNLFLALTGGLEAEPGASPFIDTLLNEGLSGAPALFGIEWRPDVDFLVATSGFAEDAVAPASNLAGFRIVAPLDEPGMLLLVGLSLLGLKCWRGPWLRAIRSCLTQGCAMAVGGA